MTRQEIEKLITERAMLETINSAYGAKDPAHALKLAHVWVVGFLTSRDAWIDKTMDVLKIKYEPATQQPPLEVKRGPGRPRQEAETLR